MAWSWGSYYTGLVLLSAPLFAMDQQMVTVPKADLDAWATAKEIVTGTSETGEPIIDTVILVPMNASPEFSKYGRELIREQKIKLEKVGTSKKPDTIHPHY